MPPEPRSGRDNPYYGYSTPMISGRLCDLVGEMGVRPMYKTLRLAELVEWVMHDLPEIAPDDPRTLDAMELANVLWERSRD
jgi:hypothetical protein